MDDVQLDNLNEELRNKVRGSSGKTHPTHHGRKTNKAVMNNIVHNSQDHKKNEAERKILHIIERFPEYHGNEDLINRFRDRYIEWIKTCLLEKKLILRKQDIEEDFFKASSAGGQNVNSRGTAVRLLHRITNLIVENEEERAQHENLERAEKHLKEKLAEHLKDWAIFLQEKDPKDLTRYDITDLLEKAELSEQS